MELAGDISFPDAADVSDDYPWTLSAVSNDGVRLACVSYGRKRGQVQTMGLASAKGTVRQFDLAWSSCEEPELLTVGLSPDLGVLVVDADVFQLIGPHDGPTLVPYTIGGLPESLEAFRRGARPAHWCKLQCHVSPCNSYIVYFCEGDPWSRKTYPTTSFLFRIDTASRWSTRLDLPLPETLMFVSADFHPSLPLIVVSYSSSSEPNYESPEHDEPLPIHVAVVNLESLRMTQIKLPGNAGVAHYIEE